jgi:hypothetical protein
MPLRQPFLNACKFVLPGGVRIFVRDQPGALAYKDKQQGRSHKLWPSESLE